MKQNAFADDMSEESMETGNNNTNLCRNQHFQDGKEGPTLLASRTHVGLAHSIKKSRFSFAEVSIFHARCEAESHAWMDAGYCLPVQYYYFYIWIRGSLFPFPFSPIRGIFAFFAISNLLILERNRGEENGKWWRVQFSTISFLPRYFFQPCS